MKRRIVKKYLKKNNDYLGLIWLRHIRHWSNLPQDGITKYLIKFDNAQIRHGRYNKKRRGFTS